MKEKSFEMQETQFSYFLKQFVYVESEEDEFPGWAQSENLFIEWELDIICNHFQVPHK